MDMTNITTNAQVQPAKMPVTRVAYHGKAGQVFRLHLANLFLTVITLGIYSFWGKTRIRKYMTSHIALQNERFEYTGTGKELLVGALKAIFILGLLFLGIGIISYAISKTVPFIGIIFYIFLYISIFALIPVVVYLALRYRLSRTRWRGIRFNLGGLIKEYFILCFKRTIISAISLGIAIPQSDIQKWSYIANHMTYGDLKFSFQANDQKMKKIVKIHLMSASVLVIMILGGGVLKGQELLGNAREHYEQTQQNISVPSPSSTQDPLNQVTPQAGDEEPLPSHQNRASSESPAKSVIQILGFGLFFFARLWYHAALWQEKFRGLTLAGLRFKTDMTGGGLAKLYFTNILIIIFTLGLGKPIALNRTLRYYATNLRIAGDLNALIAQQDQSKKTSGLGDALAADVGFDLGL